MSEDHPQYSNLRSPFIRTLRNNIRKHYRTVLRSSGIESLMLCRQKVAENPDGWLSATQLEIIDEVLRDEGINAELLAQPHVGTGEEELHEPHHPHMRRKRD